MADAGHFAVIQAHLSLKLFCVILVIKLFVKTVEDRSYTPEMIRRLDRENPFFRPPGGESQNDVERRMTDFIKDGILDRYEDGNLLVVGHGVAFKCFIRGVLGSDARMTHKLGIDNLSVTRLTYTRGDSGGWTLDWLNRSLLPSVRF